MRIKQLTFSILGLSFFFSAAFAEQTEILTIIGQKEPKGLNLNDENSASSRLGLEIIDTPASQEIITKEEITIKADHSSLSAVTRTTGFSSSAGQGNGGTSMSVRGFNGHGSVVQTFDGTHMYVGAGTRTFPADTWSLEKIEVLRGPGSVINGVGAIGATVNYVPKIANFKNIENEIDVSIGSFNLQRLAFGSGGRLTDNTAYRFDIVNHNSNSSFDNSKENKQVVAGSIRFKPDENIDIKLSVDYADVKPITYWGTPLVNGKIIDSTRNHNYNIEDGIVNYIDWWPRLNFEWKINHNLTLRSDTYYLEADRHWRNIEEYAYNTGTGLVDRALYLEILHKLTQVGNRSDLLFDFNIDNIEHRISLGVEFNQIDFMHLNNRPYNGSTTVSLNHPNTGTWSDGAQSETTRDFISDTLQYALFFESHMLFNEQWSLITGIRQDQYDYERDDFNRSNGETAQKTNSHFSGSSWRLGVVYQPLQDISLYAQYSKALDSIGSVLTASNPHLKLAEGNQLEMGIKQLLWSSRLQYTIAIYHIEKANLISNDPGGISRQIGQQSSQGLELDTFIKPTDNFNIDFNIALVDAKYDEFVSGNADLSGKTPRNIPGVTANLWMNWQFIPQWQLSGGARYVDKRYTDNANTASIQLPDYTVFDVNLQWLINPNLKLSLRGKNITDENDYVLSSYGSTQWILAEGRSTEVGIYYTF
ncbi:TonB-dependent receptor [Aliikangiella sp. IMCC44359]|uniref:TonB-dependent receptor n=1 Tax=Aliikangiella sp. IMCC44359 TaxID=3459125 RepID=UPI00403B2C68